MVKFLLCKNNTDNLSSFQSHQTNNLSIAFHYLVSCFMHRLLKIVERKLEELNECRHSSFKNNLKDKIGHDIELYSITSPDNKKKIPANHD